ncbi:PucR family transcriptional regulator [Rhodococcus triatomae]|nr:CdaR family transcriptional regulator [Rhodococcus triatomae BKS 15-14]
MSETSWRSVVEGVDAALARLDTITDDTVTRIRDELPDFVLVPYAEHRESVREQLRRRLVAFSERRAWDQEDLDEAQALAERRARQAIALDVVIRAYHVGDRELWRNLSAAPGDVQVLLPELASLMLETLQAVTSTLARAHASETRARDRVQMAVSQRLIDLLNTHSPEAEAEASRLAEYLGFVVSGPFVALAYVREERGPHSVSELEPATFEKESVVARGGVDAVQVLVIQADDNRIVHIVESLTASTFRVGVGSRSTGIRGASRSLRQSQLALAGTSPHKAVSKFSEDWIVSCTLSLADLLDQHVLRVAEIANANRPLRDTVVAFSDSDMSITQCARTSHLHANTVVYRLGRWRELTGWDPRTFAGLTRSVTACALADTLRSSSRPTE